MNKDIRNALIIGGIVLALLIVVPSVWGGFSGWSGGFGMMGTGMMGTGGFMGIGLIVFWGLVIWAIVALARGNAFGGSQSSPERSDSALDILKKRYARGEISREEFEDRKKDLI